MRWDMTDDLVNNYKLKGKSEQEVKRLLGEPGNSVDDSPDRLYYDLGPCRRGIDYGSMYVELKIGKVVHVEVHCN